MFPDSERHYWDALRGNNPQSCRDAANCLSSLLRQRGNLVAAERLLRKSLREHGWVGAAGTWLRLAKLLQEEARTAEAGRAYAKALNLATVEECPEVVIDLAAQCLEAGETARASKLYEDVATNAAEAHLRAVAAYRLAAIQLRLDSADRAIATLRQALAEADLSLEPFVLVDLAKLLIDIGEPKEAAALLECAIDGDHHDQAPRAAFTLAELRRQEGDPLEAYRLFQLVIECGHPSFASQAKQEQERLIHFEIDTLLTAKWESSPGHGARGGSSASNRLAVLPPTEMSSLYCESVQPYLLTTWIRCERTWTLPRLRPALLRDSLAMRKPQIEKGVIMPVRRHVSPPPRFVTAAPYSRLSIAAYDALLPFQLSWVVAFCEDLLVTWLAKRLLADGGLRVDGEQTSRERLLYPSLPQDEPSSEDREQSPLALDLLAPESPRCNLETESDGPFLRCPGPTSRASHWLVHTIYWLLASRALEAEPAKVVPQLDSDCLPKSDMVEVAGSLGDGHGVP